MQTFLPYRNYENCARVLDDKRLGKQRVEVLQILNCLNGKSRGWNNHPAVNMWRGYSNELIFYGCFICDEWVRRGFKDTCRDKIVANYRNDIPFVCPPWMGEQKLHYSHRCNLYRKKPEYYVNFFGVLPTDVPYYWPTDENWETKTSW